MTEEQAKVHLATMNAFAKLTMDPRLRKTRERMSKRRKKKKIGKTHADGVPSCPEPNTPM